ncbi:MAG TPA: hypothetical protein VEI24_00630, partial [Nitrospiria bacterium]|nr:hypothetical protein [Nitrospiria bacterium]
MNRRVGVLAVIFALLLSSLTGTAIAGRPDKPLTVAVFGDWPYSTTLLADAPLLLNSVNTDPDVRLVIHVGDI